MGQIVGAPVELYQGDYVTWVEAAPEEASGLTVWLRANTAGAGVQAVAVLTGNEWVVSLTAQVTGGMVAGGWELQVVAVVDGQPQTVRRGALTVRQGLAFAGESPGAFDDRSQTERDLEAVDAAIRALVAGAQEYAIGGPGGAVRRVRRADLAELRRERDELRGRVAVEKRREKGFGSGRILVRFA